MITVFSMAYNEETTNNVIDWLRHLNGNYIRINGEDIIETGFNFSSNEISKQTNVVWFRRGIDLPGYTEKFLAKCKPFVDQLDTLNSHRLLSHIKAEINEYLAHFYSKFSEKHWLTKYSDRTLSKCAVLDIAKRNGLKVPEYLATTSREQAQNFHFKHKRIITKNFSEVQYYTTFTEFGKLLTVEPDIDRASETFFVSLFQQYIEKEFEIRTFYLDREFFSMAIFSQRNEKTMIDFRNYDLEKPNRNVPFKLPTEIEANLQRLIDELGLNNCSIDLIKALDGCYYFLEINPVGQFGMTSGPCNYNLEKRVAKYLIKMDSIYGK